MKRNRYSLVAGIVGVSVGLLTSSAANAQSGPSGSFTNTVSGPTNAVWDFGGAITNATINVTGSDGTTVDVAFPVTVAQSGTGKLSGSGDTTVQLSLDTVPQSFAGTYKVTGSVTSGRGGAHILYTATGAGTTTLPNESKPSKVSASHQDNGTIDNAAQTVTGKRKLTAKASGKGAIVVNTTFSSIPINAVGPLGNGTWTLELTVSTDVKNKVTGSGAVRLNSGQSFSYNVKGVFNPKTNLSKLVLTGADVATKGSTLQVAMSGSTVVAIKGKITGQLVSVIIPTLVL